MAKGKLDMSFAARLEVEEDDRGQRASHCVDGRTGGVAFACQQAGCEMMDTGSGGYIRRAKRREIYVRLRGQGNNTN